MSEPVVTTDLLRTLGATQSVPRVDGNNLQLTDQIQFSQILKVMVDSPEQTLEAAQTPVDPADQVQRSDKAESEFGRQLDRHRDGDAPRETAEPRKDNTDAAEAAGRPESADRKESPRKNDGSAENKAPGRSDDGNEDLAQTAFADEQSTDAALKDKLVELAEAPVGAPVDAAQKAAQTPAKTAADQAAVRAVTNNGQAPATKGSLTSKTAAEVLTSALTNDNFSKVGEDLHTAVSDFAKETSAPKAKAPSAANSLVNKQEQELAEKLGKSIFGNTQINVAVENARMNAAPTHTLASTAQLAELAFEDGINGQTPPTLTKAAGGAADRQMASNHNNMGGDRAFGQTTQQDNFQNFGMAVRAQAAANGAQQAAAQANVSGKAAITPETANVNNLTGTSGPSQVSQTAKANPTTAARQPQKAPVPAEQIAVNIKKAIGDGADKINIKLNPAQLGRVEVKLDIGQDGRISAMITAEKPETLDLLKNDVRGLDKALQEAGLKSDLDSFNFGLKKQAEGQAEPGRDRQDSHAGKPSEGKDAPEEDLDNGILANANVYGRNMATNGGVDIRI